MTDVQTPQEESPEKLLFYKDIEFYSASVAAWYNSSLEHDKSLLTLSAGGIGLLISFGDGLKSQWSFTLYVLAIISFIVSLISVLLIFQGNKNHIIKLFSGEDFDNPYLAWMDKIAMWSFALGVIFAAIIGVSTAYQQLSKEKAMSGNTPKTTRAVAMESVNGVQLLQKSFTGAQQLRPQAAATSNLTPSSSSNTTQQPAQAASATPQAGVSGTQSSNSSGK